MIRTIAFLYHKSGAKTLDCILKNKRYKLMSVFYPSNRPIENDFGMKNICLNNKIPFIILGYKQLHADSFSEILDLLDIDLIICNAFSFLIPMNILNLSKHGGFNIHPSYLPEYKGARPLSRAIEDKKSYAGITLHKMNNEFDSGKIIIQHKLPIYSDDTFDSLYNRFIRCIPMVLDKFNSYLLKEKI